MVNAAEADNSSDVIMGNLLVNDIPAKVLFDSGASHSFLSIPFASKHNVPVEELPSPLSVVSPGKFMHASTVLRMFLSSWTIMLFWCLRMSWANPTLI